MKTTITTDEYQRQWELGWPDLHPEDYCQRCLNRNINWFVDSDRFNAAAQNLGFRSTSILCPACFVEGHENATGLTCTWQLVPGTHFSHSDQTSKEEQWKSSQPKPASPPTK